MKVCLFDIDGTLLQTGGVGTASLEAALESEFGIPCDGSVETTGRTDRAIVEELMNNHDIQPSDDNWRRMRDGYLAHLPRILRERDGYVLPGIVALLEMLARRTDVAVGLLTGNTCAGANQKLVHYGLDRYFSFGGFGDDHTDRDDVGHAALRAACVHLEREVRTESVFVIGDTPADVRCARAIEARAIAVATGWHSHEELRESQPDLLVTDLSDPQPLLDLL